MFYLSLIIIQTIIFESHFLVYVTVRDVFGLSGETLLVLKIIFGVLSVSFVFASIITRFFYNKTTRIIYSVAAIWFGFLIYFLLAAAAYWLLVLAGGKEVSGSEASFAGVLFFAAASGVGIFGLVNANKIRTKNIVVEIPNLPPSWAKRKAVLVSDIHLGQIRGKKFAEKISLLIAKTKPDIVFFVGDVFDGAKTDEEKSLLPLSKTGAPLGNFFVVGNHEEFGNDSAEKYTGVMQRAGFRVLQNEKIVVDGLEIMGISDSDTTKKSAYEEMMGRIVGGEKKCPRILLKHTPVFTDVAEKTGIDLELSGHTHGGQVFPFNIVTPLIFKDRNYGLSRFGKMATYTSSGAGTWGPPMRIGTDPEIVVISFRDIRGPEFP